MVATKLSPKMLTASAMIVALMHLQVAYALPNPQWRLRMAPRRRNGGSAPVGCRTPQGMMELGQRIYPKGCTRIVCKTISGQPIIEHQFCNNIQSQVPDNCITQSQHWKRYPDCCPEIVCPPSSSFYDSGGAVGTISHHGESAFRTQGQSFPAQSYNAIRGSNDNVMKQAAENSAYQFDFQSVTPSPTEIIYGQGFSRPYQSTSPTMENVRNQLRVESSHQHPNFWDTQDTYHLDSPGNILSGMDSDVWKAETNTEAPFRYQEHFLDSTTIRPFEVTPYIITYPTNVDFIYKSVPASYHYFTDPSNVKTSPLPYREHLVGETPATTQPPMTQILQSTTLETADGTTTSKEVTVPYYRYPTKLKNKMRTPYIEPTTYSPHTKLIDRFRQTIPIKQQTTNYPVSSHTKPQNITTPNTEWSTKAEKYYPTETTNVTPSPSYYNTKRLTTPKYNRYTRRGSYTGGTTRLPWVGRTTTIRPYERITKRTQTSSTSKKYAVRTKTTPTPYVLSQTTPANYEFATAKLNPSNHDLIEFIHSTLDPSALIPGHDTYLQSKFDFKKEYGDKHTKTKRSLSDDQATGKNNGTEEIEEEVTEKRGRPMFYIPWRDEMGNILASESTTPMTSTSTEKSSPLTKVEQVAYFLQSLSNTSTPSFNMKTAQLLENKSNFNSSLNAENLESDHFSISEQLSTDDKSLGSKKFPEESKLPKSEPTPESSKSPETEQIPQSVKVQESKQIIEGDTFLDDNQTPIIKINTEAPKKPNKILDFEDINNTTVSTSNVSLDATQNTSQLKLEKTITKSPYIAYPPASLTSKPPNTQLIENENKNPRLRDNTPEIIIPVESEFIKKNTLKIPSTEDTQKLNPGPSTEDTQKLNPGHKNTTINNHRRRIPVYRREPRGRRRGSNRSTSSTRRRSRGGKENENQSILNKSAIDVPAQEETLPSASLPSKQSRNRRPNSRTSRTRGHVPSHIYGRRNKKEDSKDLSYEANESFIILQDSALDEQVPSPRNNRHRSSIADEAKETVALALSSLVPEAKRERDESKGINLGNIPAWFDRTSDQVRKYSNSQYLTREMKNEYKPGKPMAKQSNNPHFIENSEFSSTMDSAHTVEQVKDSYYKSESYSNHFDDPHSMPKPEDRMTDRKYPNYKGPPTSATTQRKTAHLFNQDSLGGYSNPHQESTPNTSNSGEYFTPPYYKRFMEDFGDFPQEDWSNDPNFGPLFPRDEDDYSSETDSKHNYSHSNDQNTKINYPSPVKKAMNNYAQNKVRTNKTPMVLQTTTARSQDSTVDKNSRTSSEAENVPPPVTLKTTLWTKSPLLSVSTHPVRSNNAKLSTRQQIATAVPSSQSTNKSIYMNPLRKQQIMSKVRTGLLSQTTAIPKITQIVTTIVPDSSSVNETISDTNKEKTVSVNPQPSPSTVKSQTEEETDSTRRRKAKRRPRIISVQQRRNGRARVRFPAVSSGSPKPSLSTAEETSEALENTEDNSSMSRSISQPVILRPNTRQRASSFTRNKMLYNQPASEKLQSRTPQPRIPQPRTLQPRTPQSRIPQPRAPQLRTPQPRTPQPRTPQPRTPQPRTPQPRTFQTQRASLTSKNNFGSRGATPFKPVIEDEIPSYNDRSSILNPSTSFSSSSSSWTSPGTPSGVPSGIIPWAPSVPLSEPPSETSSSASSSLDVNASLLSDPSFIYSETWEPQRQS